MTVNRHYQDQLFRLIFGNNKKYLLEIYNALNDTNYTCEDDLTYNTLDNVIYMAMKNDISFILDSQMMLYEQQSTFNPNMPIRGLFYFASLYNAYTKEKDKTTALPKKERNIYSKALIKVPTPNYVVFYTGKDEKPDIMKLKLSDAFEVKKEDICLECVATMINLNRGHNKPLMDKCKSLRDYSIYVILVKENIASGMTVEQAVEKALATAIDQNFLDGFFKRQRDQIMALSMTEFSLDEYGDLRFSEGKEEGYSQAKAEDQKTISDMQSEIAKLKEQMAVLQK